MDDPSLIEVERFRHELLIAKIEEIHDRLDKLESKGDFEPTKEASVDRIHYAWAEFMGNNLNKPKAIYLGDIEYEALGRKNNLYGMRAYHVDTPSHIKVV